MPGAKRKIDEDTWLARQSKKFKCGQILGNVYESTLAKLRLGARQFFANGNAHANSPPGSDESETEKSDPPGASGGTGTSNRGPEPAAALIPRRSRIVRAQQSLEVGTLNLNVPIPIIPNPVIPLCDSCSNQRKYQLNNTPFSPVNCGFCDKPTCHLNECCECSEGFCGNCSLQKYDDGIVETFICRGCFHG